MLSALVESIHVMVEDRVFDLFVFAILYFWLVWGMKILLLFFYRPKTEELGEAVSVVMPVYNEDRDVLHKAIGLTLAQPAEMVAEIILVIDSREAGIREWILAHFGDESRLRVVETFDPGKRFSLALGIRSASRDIVVSVESDVFVYESSIRELVKPFVDPKVGGVVGDQRIYRADDNALYWVNAIAESVKYNLTYPSLSVLGQVTVLSGRCVAYRREAVLPLLDDLTHEIFLGKRCVSGDDGRLTSLLLAAGWQTLYQGTSWIETISPPTWKDLMRQQTRWFRNTGRRTTRALLWDRGWVWKGYPLALWQMVTTWTNTVVVGTLLFAIVLSMISRSWFWFGTDALGVALRVALIVVSMTLTRFIRSFPGLRHHPRRKWFFVFLLPWYGLVLWVVKVYALFTMNKQGWVTRDVPGQAGGFEGIGPRLETVALPAGTGPIPVTAQEG